METLKTYVKASCALACFWAIMDNLNAYNSDLLSDAIGNGIESFDSTSQNAQTWLKTDLDRVAAGGPFLMDFFEPFLRFDAYVDTLNRMVDSFNARYSTKLVHQKDDKEGRTTAIFDRIERGENSSLFRAIKVMQDHSDPRHSQQDSEMLGTVFDELASQENLKDEKLEAALTKMSLQVGYGWHLKDGLYCEGVSEDENGAVEYASGCTITVEDGLEPVIRAYFLTEDIRQIAATATRVQQMIEPLITTDRERIRNLFVQMQDSDSASLRLFYSMGAAYKLTNGIFVSQVERFLSEQQGREDSSANRLEQIEKKMNICLSKIEKIERYSK